MFRTGGQGFWALLPGCAALLVVMLMAGAAQAAAPFCGDNKCTGKETAVSCPQDCSGGGDICGDGACTGTESCSSCSADCGICPPTQCNFDGICNDGEDCLGCPSDCAGQTGGKPSGRYCCGADTCQADLCGAGCGDPAAVCGNGTVESGEECDDGNLVSGDGCDDQCKLEASIAPFPGSQFNVGDSIGEGEAADGTIGSINHQTVWSTGYDASDAVDSLNERFDASDPTGYYENNATRDAIFNRALSGSVMADFAGQAQEVVAGKSSVPNATETMVTVLLGNNDVCAPTLADMTDPGQFEAQYRAGLDVLAQSPATADADILVSSIPAIYWLWNAKRTDLVCRLFIWPFVPCQDLLSHPADDCESADSRLDPDTIYPGDGPNCVRRKTFHAAIRDIYNPILHDVLEEYRTNGALPNAQYVNIFDVPFDSVHVNDGDCFHPSVAGHALLAEKEWCRSTWGAGDAMCLP